MADIEVPVLIVGGGGAGLTASMLLAGLGVQSLLVSALPTTSVLPKAHVLNQRAMEILDDAGIASTIYEVGTPRSNMAAAAIYAGFAGHPDAGRRLARLEAWGGGGADLAWEAASPRHTTNLPQIRLEPIMKARAEELNPGHVRFHHELIDLQQDEDGVTSVVRDLDSGEEYTVRSAFVLACDGGRRVGPLLGVEMVGVRDVADEISIHMTADLSAWAPDPDVLIRWIWVPHEGTLSVLVPMGPTRWGPESEEWVFHLNYPYADPRSLDDSLVEADMRTALGIGDHPVDIHMITRWELVGLVASELRVGRVFLCGDAAHRHPPTGGLGLTSAIHDVHNLCWKIAAVLEGWAETGLLESYEPERRSSVQRNVDRSVENALNHMVIGAGLGLSDPESTPEQRWAAAARLWSDDPADLEHRHAAVRLLASQSMEHREHNVEYGYLYDSPAIITDGTPEPEPIDPIRVYEPSTRPGGPLPHAWLDAYDGSRCSTIDLVQPGRFLVIAGEDGQDWIGAAEEVSARLGLPLDAVRIGHLDGDLLDPQCVWISVREFSAQGAILVRPDRFIAWRSLGASATPSVDLEAALSQILRPDSAA
jgi:2,4-dichlorophenol 6-monooxygenase